MDKFWSNIKSLFSGKISYLDEKKQPDVERIAIDQCGYIGSNYNIYHDAIVGELTTKVELDSSALNGPITCRLYHGRTPEAQNLLRMVGLNEEQILSILLQIIPATGIATIIKYPRSIDKNTRFFYLRHETRIESSHHDLLRRIQRQELSNFPEPPTHIITKVIRGIHTVVVLQLPIDQQAAIDGILERIRTNFEQNEDHMDISPGERALMDRIISTIVYSNIPALPPLNNFYDVCQKILHMRNKSDEHRHVKYILSPILSHQPGQNDTNVTNAVYQEPQLPNFENNLLMQLSEFRVLQLRLDYELPELLQDKLEERLKTARESFSETKKIYDDVMGQIGALLIRLRKKEDVISLINEILNSDVQQTLECCTRRVTSILNDLTSKGNLIKRLQNTGFTYYDVTKVGFGEEHNESSVKDALSSHDPNWLVFCASDSVKQESPQKWDELHSRMITDKQKNARLSLVYADFTYTKWSSAKMTILSSKVPTMERSRSTLRETFRQSKRKAPSPPSTSSDTYVNILLLGESGVGKSTFINAFANYLRYDTLEQAESSKPFVIIPVSFLMTVNDDFHEQLVKFGDADANEDHSNSGQSVTQQCRSYVFGIARQKKLRFIDTPGFGDTRGENQDELNMEMIFSYIHHLPYLNGVCLLFKPNVARLNPFLYSCCTQLFRFFGKKIRDHLIFCFTNTRSTFFAPGDTRPLLKTLLDSLPVKPISFDRTNTFCFDSEAFRYLVALQKSLTFEEIERNEFEKSWKRSVEESRRFEGYLCEHLRPYRKNTEWQSVQEAQLQVTAIIRPILETMHNILRNILLHSIHSSIELKATCLTQDMMICYSSDRQLAKCGECYILVDHLHPSSNQCTLDQHSSAMYRLEYDYLLNETNESIDMLHQQRTFLCEVSTKFARFLLETRARKDDPFLSGLVRMIEEEKFICAKEKRNGLNQQLVQELEKFKSNYEQFYTRSTDHEKRSLSRVYELIVSVDNIPMIKEQTDAIRNYQQFLLLSNERNLCKQTT